MEPFEAIDLIVPLGDVLKRNLAPAAFHRITLRARRSAVGISSITTFKLFKVSGGKRACLLGDRRYIRASVIEPKPFRRLAFGKEHDVGLRSGGIGSEGSTRTTEYRV